jgi:hypothetical protein
MEHEISITFGKKGNTEIIIYTPGEFPDRRQSAVLRVRCNKTTINLLLEAVIRDIFIIVDRACRNSPLGNITIEKTLDQLSNMILPPEGFLKILPLGFDPVFSTDEDFFSIPWEMFEEKYLQCEEDPPHTQIITDEDNPARFCSSCGKPLKIGRKKFGINRIVSHKIIPRDSAFKPESNNFLMIIDPQDDLCKSNSEYNECDVTISEICDFLTSKLKTKSNQEPVEILRGSSANVKNVLSNIGRSDLVGIYYFGHGQPPKGGEDGKLILADGPLYSEDIEKAKPKAPFIMINACWSASRRDNWNHEDRFESVTHAFAKGPEKTVIGSLWPIPNTQASIYASKIIRKLFVDGETAGEALRDIRKESLENFQSGKPDTAWMSYRLFGSASQKFIVTQASVLTTPAKTITPQSLFDSEGKLIKSLFGFNIDDVLLRSAKRRNFQKRDLVTVEDIFAGLIRKGNLLRFLCLRAGYDPDKIYREFEKKDSKKEDKREKEEIKHEKDAISFESELLELFNLERWIIDSRDDFEPDAVEFLADALKKSNAARKKDSIASQMSEKDMIETALIGEDETPRWMAELDKYLFPASLARKILDAEIDRKVDANGILIIQQMDDSAMRIIKTAHELAQQRGMRPIPNRLLLVAFLSNKRNPTWQKFENAGLAPDTLKKLLLQTAEGGSPEKFELSYEACQRTIIPVIEKAIANVKLNNQDTINEESLFAAFTEAALPEFKRFVDELTKQVNCLDRIVSGSPLSRKDKRKRADDAGDVLPISEPESNGKMVPQTIKIPKLDIDALISILSEYDLDISSYDDEMTQILVEAANLAIQQLSPLICSTHLFAAMIGNGSNILGRQIQQQGIDPIDLKQLVLNYQRTDTEPNVDLNPPKLSQNVLEVLINSFKLAKKQNLDQVTLSVMCNYTLSREGIISSICGKLGLTFEFDND